MFHIYVPLFIELTVLFALFFVLTFVNQTCCVCIRLTGSTTFKDNAAYWGGAIYNTANFGSGFNGSGSDFPISITSFPDDTVFENNTAEVRPTLWNPPPEGLPSKRKCQR